MNYKRGYLTKTLDINNMQNNYFVANIIGDGNCFYRCISLTIFGHEAHHDIIRFLYLYILLDYEKFFTSILRHEITVFETFFLKTAKLYEYATHINIVATSVLLNRPLFIYQYVNSNNSKYNLIYNFSSNSVNFQPILIAYYPNHFEAIFMSSEICGIPLPEKEYSHVAKIGEIKR